MPSDRATREPARHLAAELSAGGAFLILGHVDPDGDCIASQLLLESLLLRLGKRARLYNAGPFARPEILRYAGRFAAAVDPVDRTAAAAAVVVDCSTPERLGPLAEGIGGLETLVVDHHASGTPFGEVRYLDPTAPAAALLVLDLYDALGLEPTREEAELALFGLCTDTAFFRHLDERAAGVFGTVERLVRCGASPQKAFGQIYGGRSLAERRLLGATLAGAESLHDGRLVLCSQRAEDVPAAGAGEGSSDELYRLLQTVAGVSVIALIRQEAASEWSVGLRSLGGPDVGAIARRLGGGGHAPAAGCTLFGTFEEVRARVLAGLEPLFR